MSPDARRTIDAPWFKAVQQLGLPTVLTLALLWKGSQWVDQDRQERATVLAQMAANLSAQTQVLQQLSRDQHDLTLAITATWPAVRLQPRRAPTEATP